MKSVPGAAERCTYSNTTKKIESFKKETRKTGGAASPSTDDEHLMDDMPVLTGEESDNNTLE